MPFSLPHAGATTVLVDELDAGRFESSGYNFDRRPTWVVSSCFELPNGYYADPRLSRQFCLAPIEEAARRPALSRRDHSKNTAEGV